jgi:hypothetical protein
MPEGQNKLPDDIIQYVKRDFGEDKYIDVCDMLSRAQYTDRITRAIVYLAEGNLNKLKHFIRVAQMDHKDILFWAEGDKKG